MYNVTRLIHLTDGVDGTVKSDFATQLRRVLTNARQGLVEPTLPGSRNGGDLLLHGEFDSDELRQAGASQLRTLLDNPLVCHVDGVDYSAAPVPVLGPPGTVYRTLLLSVAPGTPGTVINEFEADLQLMPRYVKTIIACRLSRPERTLGGSRWTHVFEQQFTDEQGIMGAYLMHPIHWARVDRWFDPECPEYIVRERVCHSFCHVA